MMNRRSRRAAARGCASAPRPARPCRNRSAMPGSRASASTFSTASVRPSCCISSCRTRPAGDGYWNQRRKSRSTFEGYWTRTGDKYIRDAEGRYTFCGRSDDMFKVSGIWVSPFEVESALITHPAVLEAAVVPEADPEGLLKPKAFVVLRADTKTDGLHDALKEHVKQKIGPWKYPRWIEVVDSLPKTATGKIQRFKLREGDAAKP